MPRVLRRDLPRIGFIAIALAGLGCSTYAGRLEKVHAAYYAGRFERAEALLEDCVASGGRDRSVYALELALVELALGKTREAEAILRRARDGLEAQEKARPTDYLAAALLDDRSLPYGGEDYEKIMVRAMLALVNLFNGGDDAIAYANQVFEKQQEILDELAPDGSKYKRNYKIPGIGPYLRGMLSEVDFRNYDTALRNYRLLKELEPGYARADEDIERMRSGVHARRGHGVLYVFALLGPGPRKVEIEDVPSTAVLNIASIIIGAARDRFVTLSVVPIRVPEVRVPPSDVTEVLVSLDGRTIGATSTVTDVGALAVQQFDEARDWIYARALLRRIAKKAAIEVVKHQVKQRRKDKSAFSGVDLVAQLVSIAWEAVQHADTRCWSLLPGAIQVLRLELPAGVHDVAVAAADGGASHCAPRHVRVRIEAGRDAHVLVIAPGDCVMSAPICSNPAPIPAP